MGSFFMGQGGKMDQKFMEMALEEALKGKGKTKTNPLVGAVLVKDGQVVSKGYHAYYGGPHAEVRCLKDVEASGGTLYVTLEPCSHYGKTPPCVDLLIQKKLRRVVVGELDSNPLVSGRGIKKLKEAGIEVTSGVLEEKCHSINKIFHFTIQKERPYVVLKMAQTLDGKIATITGDSQWITGPEAREDGHRLRGICDGILVGRGTALKDNPRLTCRTGGRNPLRIVLDRELKTPKTHHLFQDEKTIFYVGEKIKSQDLTATAKAVSVKEGQRGLDLSEVLKNLYREEKVSTLLVEGGSQVITSFIREGLVDQWVIYQAPLFIGETGKSAVGDLGVQELKDAFYSEIRGLEAIGKDVKIQGGRECLLEL